MDNRRQSRDRSAVVVQVEPVLRYTIPPDLLFGICFVFCSTLVAAVLFSNEVKEGKTQTTANEPKSSNKSRQQANQEPSN